MLDDIPAWLSTEIRDKTRKVTEAFLTFASRARPEVKPEMSEEEAKLRREASYLIYKKGWLTKEYEEPQSLELPPIPDWEEAEVELHRSRGNLFRDLGKAFVSGTMLAPSAWKEGLDENELYSRYRFRDQGDAPDDDMDDGKSNESIVADIAHGSEASSNEEEDEYKIDDEEVEDVQEGNRNFAKYLDRVAKRQRRYRDEREAQGQP
ncbi:hypothetical protein QIS74_12001 [Colletotrichum tabaci]|uniref:Uncharacterized protein n=1 Tax=Colletotrichum tabaci TaxID=1209068 RepID=A0AAV9SZP8_9PEZI